MWMPYQRSQETALKAPGAVMRHFREVRGAQVDDLKTWNPAHIRLAAMHPLGFAGEITDRRIGC